MVQNSYLAKSSPQNPRQILKSGSQNHMSKFEMGVSKPSPLSELNLEIEHSKPNNPTLNHKIHCKNSKFGIQFHLPDDNTIFPFENQVWFRNWFLNAVLNFKIFGNQFHIFDCTLVLVWFFACSWV